MRKRIAKIARTVQILPKQVITFDNQDFNQTLFSPPNNKALAFNKQLASSHSQILTRSAANANSVCLASNQIGEQHNAIVIHRNIMALSEGDPNRIGVQWIHENYSNHDDYVTYIKPNILKASEIIQKHEESISFPFLHFKVKRYNNIQVQYKNSNHQVVRQVLVGQSAWVYQQSFAQLQGNVIFDWRVNAGNISFQQEMVEYFVKSTSVVQEYVKDLTKVFKQYPKLLEMPQVVEKWSQLQNLQRAQELPFEQDYFSRLIKHYGRQMMILQDRIENGTLDPPKWQRPKKLEGRIIKK